MKSYRVKHPKLSSSESRKLVKILTNNDKKREGIVSVIKDGKEIWKFSSSRFNENSNDSKIRYYDYYTCRELVDYKHR